MKLWDSSELRLSFFIQLIRMDLQRLACSMDDDEFDDRFAEGLNDCNEDLFETREKSQCLHRPSA